MDLRLWEFERVERGLEFEKEGEDSKKGRIGRSSTHTALISVQRVSAARHGMRNIHQSNRMGTNIISRMNIIAR